MGLHRPKPGTFVLIDAKTGDANPLFAVRSHIDPSKMSPREAFAIQASDGVRIPGYVNASSGIQERGHKGTRSEAKPSVGSQGEFTSPL